jgi:hypothetical protein
LGNDPFGHRPVRASTCTGIDPIGADARKEIVMLASGKLQAHSASGLQPGEGINKGQGFNRVSLFINYFLEDKSEIAEVWQKCEPPTMKRLSKWRGGGPGEKEIGQKLDTISWLQSGSPT